VLRVTAGERRNEWPSYDFAERITEKAAPTGHFVAEEDPAWLLSTLETFLGEPR
jgi:hypothetical protein